MQIQIFQYIPEVGAFETSEVYEKIADELNLPNVDWLGEYFSPQREYWLTSVHENKTTIKRAHDHNYDVYDIYIIYPENFFRGPITKMIWTDVLKSLKLNIETLFEQAREQNNRLNIKHKDYLPDLEKRIQKLRKQYS